MIPMSIQLPKEVTRVWELPVPILREGNLIRAYLTDGISAPFDYNELCYALESATIDDTVRLYINTLGGDLDAANMIVDAISNSPATIIAHLSGTVASAGTMITMVCDDIVVAANTDFMIHTYSSMMGGKGQELEARQSHVNKAIKQLMTDYYAGFLTSRELTKVINGTDMWFDRNEVLRRWELRKAHLQEAANAG